MGDNISIDWNGNIVVMLLQLTPFTVLQPTPQAHTKKFLHVTKTVDNRHYGPLKTDLYRLSHCR